MKKRIVHRWEWRLSGRRSYHTLVVSAAGSEDIVIRVDDVEEITIGPSTALDLSDALADAVAVAKAGIPGKDSPYERYAPPDNA